MLWNSFKVDSAVPLLEAPISTEPSNITAKRILIKVLIEKNEYHEAQALLDEAIKQATDKDDLNELVRLLFWQGAAFAQQGDVESALSLQQGDRKGALQLANQSLSLIEQRQLDTLTPQAQSWLKTIVYRP